MGRVAMAMCVWMAVGCAASHAVPGPADGGVGGVDASGPCRGGDGVWRTEIIEAEGGAPGSLVLDGRGTPHVTYFDSRSNAWVLAARRDAGWTRETIEGSEGWYYLSPPVVDGAGATHVVAVTAQGVLYLTDRSGALLSEAVTSEPSNSWAAITIDQSGAPWIAIATYGGVVVATRHADEWVTEHVAGTSPSYTVSIASEPDMLHVASVTDDHRLEVASEVEGNWSTSTIDDGPVFGAPKLTWTDEGALRVGYSMSAPREIRSAMRGRDGSFGVSAVPAAQEWLTDFAFEPDGRLHVSGRTLEAIVHAVRQDGWWTENAVPVVNEEAVLDVQVAVGTRPESIHLLYTELTSTDGFFFFGVPYYSFVTRGCEPFRPDGGVTEDPDAGVGGPRPCPDGAEPVRIDDGVGPGVVRAGDAIEMTWDQIDWTASRRRSYSMLVEPGSGSCSAEVLGDGDPPALASNAAGDLVAVWGNDFGPNRSWARFRPAGGAWEPETELPRPAEGSPWQVGLDGDGQAATAGVTNDMQIWAAHGTASGGWTAERLQSDPAASWAGAPAAAASEYGGTIVAWPQQAGGVAESIWSSRWTTGGWAQPRLLTADAFQLGEGLTQLALGPEGQSVAFWFAGGTFDAVVVPADAGPQQSVYLGPGAAGSQSSIAVSATGDALVAWASADGVRVVSYDAGIGLLEPQSVPGTASAWQVACALGTDGQRLVTWSSPSPEGGSRVWASRWTAGFWSAAVAVSTTVGVWADSPRVAMLDDGTAFVVWSELEIDVYPVVGSVLAAVLE